MQVKASPLLRSMCSRAANLGGCAYSAMITEFIDGACVQATGRLVRRNTIDGEQWCVQVNWSINGKRSSRAEIYRRFGEKVQPCKSN